MSIDKKIYKKLLEVPKGKITTYGRVAALAGSPRAARAVGYALGALQDNELQNVPWQRVINAAGRISFKGDLIRAELQKKMLQAEGIVFDENGITDINQFGWP